MNYCVLASQVPATTLEALRLTIQASEKLAKQDVYFVTERAVEKLQENGYGEAVNSETELDGVLLVTFKRVPAGGVAAAAAPAAPAAPGAPAAAPAATAAPAAAAPPAPPVIKVDLCAAAPVEAGKYIGDCVIDTSYNGASFLAMGTGKDAKPVNYKSWLKGKFGIPLSRAVEERVTIKVPHGLVSAPATEEFTVHIWSSSGDGEDPCTTTQKLFDIPIPCVDSMTAQQCSAEEFIPLVDNKGVVFGAMNEHNLYLYWDAVHCGVENEAKILLQVLEVAIKSVGKKPQPGSPEEDKLAEDRYCTLTKKRFETLEANLKAGIETKEKEIATLGKNITEKIRQNQLDMIYLAGFQAKGYNLDILRKEYQTLRTLPRVTRVKVDASSVSIYTDTLYCEDPRTKVVHVIGRFRIVLKQDGTVAFHNLMHKTTGMNPRMNAPHVYEDGHACLGSMGNVFPTLIANGEYSAAAQMAIAFLESVNVDDSAGTHINKWPKRAAVEAKAEEAKSKKSAPAA